MANDKPQRTDEGFIKGKKALIVGVIPVVVFLLLVGAAAFVITNFLNKMSVNKDDNVCNTVRRQYSNSIQSSWPCDFTDKGDYLLVTFDQSTNTGQAPALMSFKYTKSTKKVEPAISIN